MGAARQSVLILKVGPLTCAVPIELVGRVLDQLAKGKPA
jgi:hypothetical protein